MQASDPGAAVWILIGLLCLVLLGDAFAAGALILGGITGAKSPVRGETLVERPLAQNRAAGKHS